MLQLAVRFDASTKLEEKTSPSPKPSPGPSNGNGNGNGAAKKPFKAKGFKALGANKPALLQKFKAAATKVRTSSGFVEQSRANLVIDDSR